MNYVTKSAKNQLHFVMSCDGGAIFDLSRDSLFKLTPVAAEMWNLLAEGKSESETASAIASRYEIDQDRVRSDLTALLREAAKMGLMPQAVMTADAPTPEKARMLNRSTAAEEEDTLRATPPTLKMTLFALIGLSLFDLVLFFFSLDVVCRAVKACPVRNRSKEPTQTISQVSNAVLKACVWFPHKAVCLQRSAVTACMLRINGVDAHLVIGVRPMPFLAHAWTEANGKVINDRPQVKAFYKTLGVY